MRGKLRPLDDAGGAAGGASMRPAHYAREVQRLRLPGPDDGPASMRPAHYAREVVPGALRSPGRAQCFNEARALCAGSCLACGLAVATLTASMRPAHYAREVITEGGAEAGYEVLQ